MRLNACFCRGCGKEIYRIKPPQDRRSVPVNSEPLLIKRTSPAEHLDGVKSDWFVLESGASVFGYPVGDSYDDDTNLYVAYEPHLPGCPTNGRAPRKPRDRIKRDKEKGYDYEKRTYVARTPDKVITD